MEEDAPQQQPLHTVSFQHFGQEEGSKFLSRSTLQRRSLLSECPTSATDKEEILRKERF